VSHGGWKYAAASVIGTSHTASPTGVCQDAHGFCYLEATDVFVGVVSDGAGSAPHSKTGAELSCRYVIDHLADSPSVDLFQESFARQIVSGIRKDLDALAEREECRIRDFACTLLVAIVGPDSAAFWQLGDGAMCFRSASCDTFNYVFWPDKGDYANITYFVTDENAQAHLEFDITCERIEELAMFSDGLERLALDFTAGEAHSAFFHGLFPHVRTLPDGCSDPLCSQIAQFLGSERVNKRTDDDKTLLLASRAR